MNGTELVDAVAAELADPTHVRWSRDDVRSFVSRAMTWLVDKRPDAHTVSESVQLAAGAEQTVSSLVTGAMSYRGAVRNMGSDGNTPGAAIRDVDKATIDAINPKWTAARASSRISNAVFDANRPSAFWVYPPVPASPNVHVEILVSKTPTALTAGNEGDDVDLGDGYREPVIAYAISLALRRQTDVGSLEQAQAYAAVAQNMIGVSREVVAASPPQAKGSGA